MKYRLRCLAISFAIMVVPLAARAQSKIGVINMSAAIAGTAEGKKAVGDLQTKYEPRQQELARLQKEIQDIQNKMNKSSPALSDEEQRHLARDLEDKQKSLKRDTDDAQSDFAADRDEAVRRLGQKMVHIVTEYAQQNGFALVIDGAQVPIYYLAKGIDITEEMMKRYDAANPVAGAATSAKPASPAPVVKPK